MVSRVLSGPRSCSLFKQPRHRRFANALARLRRSVIYFAVLNFVIGFGADAFQTKVRIDNMAHLGGFLCGLLLGILLVPKLGADRKLWIRRQWLAYGSVLLLVLLGARFVASFWRA